MEAILQLYIKNYAPEIQNIHDKLTNEDRAVLRSYIQSNETGYVDDRIVCMEEEEVYIFQIQTRSYTVSKDQFHRYIQAYEAVYEDILPLGTCVSLRLDVVQSLYPSLETLSSAKVIITQRFMMSDTTYFPYAGVVYPIGNLGENRIYFTKEMIETIHDRGFSDMSEDMYIFEVKQYLIGSEGKLPERMYPKKEEEKDGL